MTAYDIEKVFTGKRAIAKISLQRLRDLAKRIVGYQKEVSELFAEGRFRVK
ncbi:MAG TPA: hypothetical protein VN957_15205 [Chthoniobacterales bacterium]|nr:hypothetical protein [Chthoniobacterales bacterium]